MIVRADIQAAERKRWAMAGGVALAAHAAVAALVLAEVREAKPVLPDPVVLVELPPEAAPAVAESVAQPQPEYVPPRTDMPKIEVPEVKAPLPKERVTLPPPPPPQPAIQSRAAPPQPTPVSVPNPSPVTANGTSAGTSKTAGNDPKAKAAEADYYAMISAHLNRRKKYPIEAKKAMQQGIVTVRFTISRDGTVTAASIKRSSGHELLDSATVELLRRVSPLPRFPSSMKQETVTVSLPIDYSLKTN